LVLRKTLGMGVQLHGRAMTLFITHDTQQLFVAANALSIGTALSLGVI